MILVSPGASESPCIVHAPGVAQRVIGDQEVLGQTDDLEKGEQVHDAQKITYAPDSQSNSFCSCQTTPRHVIRASGKVGTWSHLQVEIRSATLGM